MSKIEELEGKIATMKKGIKPNTPENIKNLMVKKIGEWEAEIETLRADRKKKIVKPKKAKLPKPKPEANEPEKESVKAESKGDDDVAICKKILENANYEVKEKSVKGKDGKKRKIKTREPRQDRTIIKDRVESTFTTITKEVSKSEKDKEENKDLLEVVESVKDLFVKIMVSLDKLVAAKEIDKVKKIKELLDKLV